MCARLVGHFTGLTWRDVRSLPLRDFNALVEQMHEDVKAQNKAQGRSHRASSRGANRETRRPVMT
jgi:hypothetical protein